MDFNNTAVMLEEKTLASDIQSEDYEGFRDSTLKAMYYCVDAMFPNYAMRPERPGYREDIRVHYLKAAHGSLYEALKHVTDDDRAKRSADELIGRLPEVLELLKTDIRAGYEGDPAATGLSEIIICYPAFHAISAFRIAHILYEMGYKIPARIMTEEAHKRTGIDIHPGATIGESFFIDHGTGVVIGETTVIGKHVKLYQHVTLGAKNFPVGEDGVLVKGNKRHPNIGDNVIIYAGATILGGDVYIGDNCVIGGNVWLVDSVPAGETVYQKK